MIPCRYEDVGYFCEGYAAVKKDGKWGLVNREGMEVIPCAYDDEILDDGNFYDWEYIKNDELRERILTLIEKDKQT